MNVSAPILVESTSTTMTLRWTQPLNNGGCPIESYAIFRDDGSNGDFTYEMDSANVQNKPYLFEHTFTLSSTLTGLIIRYKLQATNLRGNTMSINYLSAILAGLPPQPITPPLDILSSTNSTQIGV